MGLSLNSPLSKMIAETFAISKKRSEEILPSAFFMSTLQSKFGVDTRKANFSDQLYAVKLY
ncbi:MAG: hypothetical protein CL926_10140 [Deltaproteobacteria bacterium]|jgi:hypothetical protein|nr:hypothetical protein [Deltaproteobacteria bacterium]|tara:strand:+ start:3026 stop:3208 length:183 start_codon:yes stop_codon:yes gene_type:complete